MSKGHEEASHIGEHQYDFYFGVHPPEVVEELIRECAGFNFTYGKQVEVESEQLFQLLYRHIQEKELSRRIPIYSNLELTIRERFGKEKVKVTGVHASWPENDRQYDWCHISSEFMPSQENAVICISPRRKNFEVLVCDISEMYLELAANVAGVNYKSVEYRPTFSCKAERLFNSLFPPINNESIPRIYKQRYMDFQTRRWLRKRNKPSAETHDARRTKAMEYIEQAFAAFEIQRRAVRTLKIKKSYRSTKGFLV